MSSPLNVLVIFDHPATLRELLAASLGAGIKLLPVRDRRAALAAVQAQKDAHAIIVEKSAASSNALEILQNAQAIRPRLRRILVAETPDLASTVHGLHSGAIDSIIYRPIDAKQLFSAVIDSTLSSDPALGSRSSSSSLGDRR